MFPTAQTKLTGESLVERRKVDDLRVERVWRLVAVQLVTWFFFALYHGYRGFVVASLTCCIEVGVISAIFLLRRVNASTGIHYWGMNLSLGASAAGLLVVSISDPLLHSTMSFFLVSILIASQLLGVRAAFGWMVVTIITQFIFYWVIFGFGDLWAAHFDDLTLKWGVAICLFLCCHQGEAFYEERTRGLMDLSNSLRRKGKKLQELATTDSLTGLLNRHQFQIVLQESVDHAVSQNEQMALLLIDMDRFKEINDTLGHPVGDLALVEIAKRLGDYFPEPALVARLGGDEFCVIMPNIDSAWEAGVNAKHVVEILTERFVFEEFDFALGASVGIAICPEDAQDPTDLLAYSDTAMFCAKNSQSGFEHYYPEMTEKLIETREMQERLSSALERDEFFLVYQPQVCVDSGRIIGVEALLRWRSDGEIISPTRFIPLLERNRRIVDVGKWVIRESCRQLKAWNSQGIDLEVSINVSSVQFNDKQFNRSIEQPIEEFGIDAKQLDFEITESLLIEDVSQAVERLQKIKDLGSSISIDDFGTGYSSLAYLQQFPLDRLKIDRAFVKNIPADDGVIASSIVALGKAIGLKVLAEGVETPEQLAFLKTLDCDEYQGYLFSKPLLAEEVQELLGTATRSLGSTSIG